MAKLLFKIDRENEVIIQCELMQELEIKMYDKKIAKFSEETKTIREVVNENFEVLLDLVNLRLLERLNSEFESEATLNGEKHFNIYRIIKVFALDELGSNDEYDFSKKNIFDSELDNLELSFIVRIY